MHKPVGSQPDLCGVLFGGINNYQGKRTLFIFWSISTQSWWQTLCCLIQMAEPTTDDFGGPKGRYWRLLTELTAMAQSHEVRNVRAGFVFINYNKLSVCPTGARTLYIYIYINIFQTIRPVIIFFGNREMVWMIIPRNPISQDWTVLPTLQFYLGPPMERHLPAEQTQSRGAIWTEALGALGALGAPGCEASRHETGGGG